MIDTQEPVWRALADPTRREILDLLRERERTTGELCDHFDLSRFGVMKHIGVLRDGGLVITQTRGRERWNYLNAVPIQQIYERWVRHFSARWAESLTSLKRHTEIAWNKEKEMKLVECKSFEIKQQQFVAAPRERVWRALTSEIDSWWPHRTMGDGSSMHLDRRAGGLFVERAANGDETLMGTVLLWRENTMIAFRGPVGMTRYTMVNMYSFEVADQEGGTLVTLLHRGFGEMDDAWDPEFNEGWAGTWPILENWVLHGKRWNA